MVTRKLILCLSVGLLGSSASGASYYEFLNDILVKGVDIKPNVPHISSGKPSGKMQNALTVNAVKVAEQRLFFVQLLQALYPNDQFGTVLDIDAINSLDLINKGSQYAALSRTMGVQTLFGDVAIMTLFSKPLNNKNEILKPQNAIRTLAENENMQATVRSSLESIAQGQALFFSFFDKEAEINKDLLARVYWSKNVDWVNKNIPLTYASRAMRNVRLALPFIHPAFGMALVLHWIGTMTEHTALPWWKKSICATAQALNKTGCSTFKELWLAHNPFTSAMTKEVFEKKVAEIQQPLNALNSQMKQLGEHVQALQSQLVHADSAASVRISAEISDYQKKMYGLFPALGRESGNAMAALADLSASRSAKDKYTDNLPRGRGTAFLLTYGGTIGLDAYYAYNCYTGKDVVAVDRAILNNMQKRLIGVASIVRGLARINEVLQAHPSLLADIPELEHIRILFDAQRTPELQNLLYLLQTRTFQGDPSYFSNSTRVLVAYKLMMEQRNAFTAALEAAGRLDALSAAAHLMRNCTPGAYCYVKFVDSSLPVVRLKKFWSPLLDYAKARANDVELGVGGDANMMLTGPNGSGKSTNMKAIVLNVVLAQTFGIAAAQEAEITPFQKIYTYLNVQENIQQSLSTFMAEARRLKQIEDSITQLPAGTRCLSIIDEGMTGTVASEGVVRLCDVCRRICRVPGSICILATHFEEPTTLQSETNGRWVNYHVEIDEPTPGNFVRLFTLKRGLNDWWFNDHQKRKRFIDWLVQLRAMKIT